MGAFTQMQRGFESKRLSCRGKCDRQRVYGAWITLLALSPQPRKAGRRGMPP
jgi:hypothetical protein